MNQKHRIIERDFYYKRDITYTDIFKFAGITMLVNLLAYYYMMCFMYLTRFLTGNAIYVVVQVLGLLPIAFFLPVFLLNLYMRAKIPYLFSLSDNSPNWRKKAIRWVAPGEIIRFLIGMIPLSITKCGVITSPITYLLYSLFYIEPFDKFDAVMLNNNMGFLDVVVFLLIYCLYFLLHSYFLCGKIKKEVTRHFIYLQGCIDEKEKYYDFNKRGNK